MTNELELPVTLFICALGLLFVKWHSKGKKKWDTENSCIGPGHFFDAATYTGNIKFMVLACLVIWGGRYIDEMGQWLWRQFGEELIVTPKKAAWHTLVARTMGTIMLVTSALTILRIYKERQQEKMRGVDTLTGKTHKRKKESQA